MMGFDAPAKAMSVSGPVRRFASSSFAERAWCDECGSHLWFRGTADGPEREVYELAPGLFDGAKDLPLTREVYADRAFRACRFTGDHARISRAEYEAEHPFLNEGDAT